MNDYTAHKVDRRIDKIYTRKLNYWNSRRKNTIYCLLMLLVWGIFLFLACTKNPGFLFLAMIIMFLVSAVESIYIDMQLMELKLDGSLIVRVNLLDEFGRITGKEYYYVNNELIMHEGVLMRGEWLRRNSRRNKLTEKPIKENWVKLYELCHSRKFQDELCEAINQNKNEYGDWVIKPINRVFKIRPGLSVMKCYIDGERGVQMPIPIPRDFEDYSELKKELRLLNRIKKRSSTA